MQTQQSRGTFILLLMGMCAVSQPLQVRAQTLMGSATVQHTGNNWAYTVQNNELASSPDYLYNFFLSIDAPVSAISAPTGWSYDTDSATYISWFNTDTAQPYPHDVAPGATLTGFQFVSSAGESLSDFYLLSWDHQTDSDGPLRNGLIAAPKAITSTAPEPSSLALAGMAIGFCSLYRHRRRK